MLAGHYAPAYALKRHYPETPLWQLFLGVQALDVLFFTLVPLGIERMALHAGAAMPLALDLQFMPYSHSLVASGCYALIAWSTGRVVGQPRVGAAIGLAIFSHWLCDALVHVPDMPLWHGDGPKIGLGLWQWPTIGIATELLLLSACYAWLRPTLVGLRQRAGDVTFGALCLVQVLNDLVLPPPASLGALAASAQLLFFAAAWLARGVDRAA